MGNEGDLPRPTRLGEVLWLEPYPDALLEYAVGSDPGPEAHYEAREAISLAFITALQLLPPRQRAAQILREVLGFRASEVAEILGSTEDSVTSALKRARATLQVKVRPISDHEPPPPPRSPTERAVVERFTRAFQADDIEDLIALLTEQVWINMPPLPFEWQGHSAAREVLRIVLAPGRHLVPTWANGQPAFGLYLPMPTTAQLHSVGMLVLTLAGDRVSAITRFDTGVLSSFNLPAALTLPL